MDDDREQEKRWEAKQGRLRALLERHGATDGEFRLDLGDGRFWWLRDDGSAAVVAAARVLLSYAPAGRSVLMGWANPSLTSAAAVPEVAGLPARLVDCDEAEAWTWAMRVGDAVGANFLYRAPSPQMWVFLGLWDVRAAEAGDAPPAPEAPWPHVQRVLDALLERHRAGDDVAAQARDYGLSFAAERAHRGGPFEGPLRQVGERLVELASGEPEALDAGLVALRAHVDRLRAS